eukprot:CAMPEP_0176135512 /NCGR_PEP_ID=MMETSP0120_2-20121206/68748_1 /TAXON_ID=160619 /ORGANISM="Kryptoperidinium foliaceum, Strain CCMP 1326" /LENGTH=253 /DNA_ID=CAMNT_0017471229 /DNA_START=45 /DNA_END=806 /DNA_ORIENTATION=+
MVMKQRKRPLSSGRCWKRRIVKAGIVIAMSSTASSFPVRVEAGFRKHDQDPSPSRLFSKISFQGDTTAKLELDAPAHHVQKWLSTPSASDVHLLGSIDATQKDEGLWECLQPRIDFMGLDLQPVFVHRISRRESASRNTGSHLVEVQVIDSRTDILGTGNANQAVGSLMSKAKFSGQSRFRVQEHRRTATVMEVDLKLGLHVPLPPFVLLPPGFNSIGSSIIKRTGRSRTEKLLRDLERAYFEWAAAESGAAD